MNIPKKLKVGGSVYQVKVTNDISLGENCAGEICYRDLVIRLRPIKIMEETFLHEIIHAVFELEALRHDEKQIESIAQGLYAVIKDNPHLFERGNK